MSPTSESTIRASQDEMVAKVEAVRARHRAGEGKGRVQGKAGIITGVGSERGMG